MNLLPVNKESEMECPCENCIVKIFCRQKNFFEFRYCNNVSHYLGFNGKQDQKYPVDSKIHMNNYPKFYKTLDPVNWGYKDWPVGHERRKRDFMITNYPNKSQKKGGI